MDAGTPQPLGGVLSLDLARSTGWAYGMPEWRVPWFGHWVASLLALEPERYAHIENEIVLALERWQPSHVVLESALPPDRQGNTYAARQAFGLRALTIVACWRAEIPYSEVSASLVRNDLLGRPYPVKPKAVVMEFLKRRGIKCSNGDQADAVMIWLWQQRTLRGLAPVAGPLFLDR